MAYWNQHPGFEFSETCTIAAFYLQRRGHLHGGCELLSRKGQKFVLLQRTQKISLTAFKLSKIICPFAGIARFQERSHAPIRIFYSRSTAKRLLGATQQHPFLLLQTKTQKCFNLKILKFSGEGSLTPKLPQEKHK